MIQQGTYIHKYVLCIVICVRIPKTSAPHSERQNTSSYIPWYPVFGPFRAFYTSPPGGRPVHSNRNSTPLGSIHPCCNYCMKNIFVHIYPVLSTTAYSQVLIYTASELRQLGQNCRSFKMAAKDLNLGPLD